MSKLTIPQNHPRPSTKPARQVFLRATLPSTAHMLTQLRTILVAQIDQHAKEAQLELFDAQRVKALAQLAQTLVLLEKQTSDEQGKIEELMEDLTPEEQRELEESAHKLLKG